MPEIGFDHCVIAVSDWERSNPFYRDVLGAELVRRERPLERLDVPIEAGPVARGRARGDGTSVHFRDPDRTLLELISYE